jgi:hypothetical protein
MGAPSSQLRPGPFLNAPAPHPPARTHLRHAPLGARPLAQQLRRAEVRPVGCTELHQPRLAAGHSREHVQRVARELRAQQPRALRGQLQREAGEHRGVTGRRRGAAAGVAEPHAARRERRLARRARRLELGDDEQLARRRPARRDRGSRRELARRRARQQLVPAERRRGRRRAPQPQRRAVGDEREERAAGRVGRGQRGDDAAAGHRLIQAAHEPLQQRRRRQQLGRGRRVARVKRPQRHARRRVRRARDHQVPAAQRERRGCAEAGQLRRQRQQLQAARVQAVEQAGLRRGGGSAAAAAVAAAAARRRRPREAQPARGLVGEQQAQRETAVGVGPERGPRKRVAIELERDGRADLAARRRHLDQLQRARAVRLQLPQQQPVRGAAVVGRQREGAARDAGQEAPALLVAWIAPTGAPDRQAARLARGGEVAGFYQHGGPFCGVAGARGGCPEIG